MSAMRTYLQAETGKAREAWLRCAPICRPKTARLGKMAEVNAQMRLRRTGARRSSAASLESKLGWPLPLSCELGATICYDF